MVIFRNDTLNPRVDWEAATVLKLEPHYWKRRALEAIHIETSGPTTPLECGLSQKSIWSSFFNPDTWLPHPPFRTQLSTILLYVISQSIYLWLFSMSVQLMKVHRINTLNCVLVLATNKLINLEFEITCTYAMSLYKTEHTYNCSNFIAIGQYTQQMVILPGKAGCHIATKLFFLMRGWGLHIQGLY